MCIFIMELHPQCNLLPLLYISQGLVCNTDVLYEGETVYSYSIWDVELRAALWPARVCCIPHNMLFLSLTSKKKKSVNVSKIFSKYAV
jgi:hypothetical protein